MKKELLKSINKNGYTVAHFDGEGKVLDYRAAATGFDYDYEKSAFAIGFEHDPAMTIEELGERIEREVGEYKEAEACRNGVTASDNERFAKELGFTDYYDLCEKSEIVYEEPGDITWYVTELPDGRWAAWDDAEISLHRVAYFDSRNEAVEFQQSGMEIAEASEQKKFVLNLKDENGIRTGYEEKLEGGSKEEVVRDYLHYLNHECNMIEDGELTEADVDCEEVDWE